jgi:hypothetical protein
MEISSARPLCHGQGKLGERLFFKITRLICITRPEIKKRLHSHELQLLKKSKPVNDKMKTLE